MNTINNSDNNSRRALGRGLSSLLSTPTTKVEGPNTPSTTTDSPGIVWVQLDKIQPNKQQPRKQFSSEAITELAQSIRDKGVLQPLLVQSRNDGTYELIAGERRLRASALAGLRQVPVIVKNTSDEESLELAMIENIQRQDLNPIEEALGYTALIERFSLTQEQVAKKVGKNRSSLANTIRLLRLPKKVQEYLASGQLTSGQVRPLINLTDPTQIESLADAIVQQGLSARAVEAGAAPLKKTTANRKAQNAAAKNLPANLVAIKDQLRRLFGTKVDILEKNGQGNIVIHYYSQEELQRVLHLFGL